MVTYLVARSICLFNVDMLYCNLELLLRHPQKKGGGMSEPQERLSLIC